MAVTDDLGGLWRRTKAKAKYPASSRDPLFYESDAATRADNLRTAADETARRTRRKAGIARAMLPGAFSLSSFLSSPLGLIVVGAVIYKFLL